MSKLINLELLNQATDNIQAETKRIQDQLQDTKASSKNDDLYVNLAMFANRLLTLSQLDELITEYTYQFKYMSMKKYTAKQVRIVKDLANHNFKPYYEKTADLIYDEQFQNSINDLCEND